MYTRIGILLVLFGVSDAVAQSFTSSEGPYKAVIRNVSRCAPASSWLQWNITTYTDRGRSLLGGSVTPSQSIKDIKFRIHMYYLEERKTKVFDMKNQNCHNTIVEVIMKTIAIPFNEQNCQINAGSYKFKDLNVDGIIHSVVQSLWYGSAQLQVEIASRKAMLICLKIYFQIAELK